MIWPMAYGLGVLSEHWGSREGIFRGCTHATYCAVYFERISGQEKPENIDLAEAKASEFSGRDTLRDRYRLRIAYCMLSCMCLLSCM